MQALYKSFYSRPFYKNLALHNSSRGFGFMALMALICSVVNLFLLIQICFAFIASPSPNLDKFLSSIPEITITKGSELSMKAPAPYILTFPYEGSDFDIAIDPVNYEKKSDDEITETMTSHHWNMLVTKTKVYSCNVEHAGEYDVSSIADLEQHSTDTFTVSGKELMMIKDSVIKDHIIEHMIKKASPYAEVLFFIVYFIGGIMMALFYSIAGVIINGALKCNFSYRTIFRLCIYCQWPASVLSMVFLMMRLDNHVVGLLAPLIVTIGYIYFAMQSAKKDLAVAH